MDEADRRLLSLVQEGFPLEARPFRSIGDALGMEEAEVISRLRNLMAEGLIRRIGPVLDARRLGMKGVLVALKVPADGADEAASVVDGYEEVSHNYLRENDTGYNLWFTISADDSRIEEILSEIKARTGLPQIVLPTVRIFKIGVRFEIA